MTGVTLENLAFGAFILVADDGSQHQQPYRCYVMIYGLDSHEDGESRANALQPRRGDIVGNAESGARRKLKWWNLGR